MQNHPEQDEILHHLMSLGVPHMCLAELFTALRNNIDITDFANPLFNNLQMRTLRLAKERGIDITDINDSRLTHKQMELLIHARAEGLDIHPLINPDLDTELLAKKIKNLLIEKENIESQTLTSMLSSFSEKGSVNKREGKKRDMDISSSR